MLESDNIRKQINAIEKQQKEMEKIKQNIEDAWKSIPHDHDWEYFPNTCDRPGCLVIHYPYNKCRKCGIQQIIPNQFSIPFHQSQIYQGELATFGYITSDSSILFLNERK
jgi:hypothetical protein